MRLFLLILALALLTPSAAAAHTPPPFRLVADAQGGFSPLGPSSGYYDRTAQEMRVVSPGRPSGVAVTIPAGCTGRGMSLPDRLLFCEVAPNFQILNTETGAVSPVSISSCAVGEHEQINFGELGRYWIGGKIQTVQTSHGEPVFVPVYLNRATGECRRFSTESDGARDVDRAGLPKTRAPSCADRGRRRLLRGDGTKLDLVFCHSKRRRIRLCRVRCTDIAAEGARSVAWTTRTRVHALLLRSGRRLSWQLAPLGNGHRIQQTALGFVGDRLYLSLDRGAVSAGEPPTRILSTRLPRH